VVTGAVALGVVGAGLADVTLADAPALEAAGGVDELTETAAGLEQAASASIAPLTVKASGKRRRVISSPS
jgi:hypothetical protein